MNTVDEQADKVNEELQRLFMTYDTKILATAMLIRGAHALRACHSAGVWKIEDVKAVVDHVISDIYDPIPPKDLPPVVRNASNSLQ